MRLIDVDEAKRRIVEFATGCHPEVLTVDSIVMLLDKTPTVDAVPVVRCKDCKQWSRNSGIAESPNGHCFCHDIETKGHDFCSYGEREEENE